MRRVFASLESVWDSTSICRQNFWASGMSTVPPRFASLFVRFPSLAAAVAACAGFRVVACVFTLNVFRVSLVCVSLQKKKKKHADPVVSRCVRGFCVMIVEHFSAQHREYQPNHTASRTCIAGQRDGRCTDTAHTRSRKYTPRSSAQECRRAPQSAVEE